MDNDILGALMDAKETEAPTEAPEAAPETAADAAPKAAPEGKPEPEVTPEVAPPVEPEETLAVTPEKEGDSQKVDEIDSDLLMRAGELGLSDEQAKGMSADALSVVLATQDRRFIAVGKQNMPVEKPPEVAPEVKPEPKAPEAVAAAAFEIPPELLENVDPVVGTTIKTLADHFTAGQTTMASMVEGAMSEMRGMMESLVQADQQSAQRTLMAEFNQTLDALGEEWTPVFGKGAVGALSEEMHANRKEALITMVALTNGYEKGEIDHRALGMKTMVNRAIHASFADKLKTVSRQEIAGQLKDREGAMLPRPKPRKSQGLGAREEGLIDIRKVINKTREANEGDDFRDMLLE